jgi:plastocyanin
MTQKRLLVVALAVISLVLLAGCGSSSKKSATTTAAGAGSTAPTAGAVSGNAVQIKSFSFKPGALKVSTGTKVTWTNKDSTEHTTTSDKSDPASWDSGHLGNGKTFSFTFTKKGTYKYFCAIHNFMTGTVEVS